MSMKNRFAPHYATAGEPVHGHSTPDPETPPSTPSPPPAPDEYPAPTHAPVQEPRMPEPPIKA
jgi:hypothetical protein